MKVKFDKEEVENQFGLKVKTIKSDNGGEYELDGYFRLCKLYC